MDNYRFTVEGNKLKDALKPTLDRLKTNHPNHAIFKAKKMQMVALPEKEDRYRFIENFMSRDAEPNIMYVGITRISTKFIDMDGEEMTGRCHNKEVKFKGTRKWETKYVLYNQQVLPSAYIEMYDTKGEAVDAAKEYAMKHDTEVLIELEKVLNGSNSRITNISPIKRKVSGRREVPDNQYVVFGKGA